MGHVLSKLSTLTGPSWVALHDVAHSFIELHKAVIHVIRLVSFCDCGFHSVCPLMDKDKRLIRIGDLWKLPDERLLLNHEKRQGFLASGEEFNPGPETRLDRSELCVIKFY